MTWHASVRRCVDGDWEDVRRMHVKLAMAIPMVVDVDLNEVLETPRSYWEQFVRTCATARDQALFIAEEGTARIGMGHVGIQGSEARLSMLYVDGEHRHQGVGGSLVVAQARWAATSGAATLVCHIPEKSAASTVAERLGWQKTEEVFYTKTHGIKEHKWSKDADLTADRPPQSHRSCGAG